MAPNSALTLAAHALCWMELARRRGEPILSSYRIAASLASHPVAVRRLLGQLREAGLVEATRGRGSGWALSRPAEDITLLDVHDALGHDAPFALHAHEPNLECPVGFGIRPVLADVYERVDSAISNELRGLTIVDVLDDLLRRRQRSAARHRPGPGPCRVPG